MCIEIRVLLFSLLGCFTLSLSWAAPGQSLEEQLIGDRATGNGSKKNQSLIEVDENSKDLSLSLNEKLNESSKGLPTKWHTMSEVHSVHGKPFKIRGPVGEPPITQWHYRDFVVYFEHDKVIHTVFNPQ